MLYTNPAVLAQIVAVVAPDLESILVEVEGHKMRLAVERGGVVTARGPRLQFREHVSWAASEFRAYDPKEVLADLKRKLRRVWVFVAAGTETPRGGVHEFASWRDFVRWVGKPSDLLEKVPWQSCQHLNAWLPAFLDTGLEELATKRSAAANTKVSKRRLLVEALEQYLNGGR